MKRNGNAERWRHGNRGAEGAEGVGPKDGVSPSPVGKDLGRKFFIFLSVNSAFWCILGACFNVSIRHVKVKKDSTFLLLKNQPE